ncbi:MAG: AAA family ATPase, partial [Burkholderiales bacterium]
GKTMLCRMLESRLPESVETAYLASPNVAPDEILHAIAFELRVPIEASASRLQVMHALQQFLLERHANNKKVVLFIEEAQGMPLATLEEIRLLSNLETQREKLLQMVLFGQPELNEHLADPGIRQLKERITHSFTLAPLSAADIKEYLAFRLRAAGYRGPDLFDGGVVRRIAQTSQGLIRRINIIADKALLAAFSDNTHTVGEKHVRAAIKDSDFGSPIRAIPWRTMAIAAGIGVVVAIALAGAMAWNNRVPPATSTAAPAATPQPVLAVSVQPVFTGINDPLVNELVETRLAATEHWLGTRDKPTHTIQIMSSGDAFQLERFLANVRQLIDVQDIFVYPTKVGGRPSLAVLYGSFATRGEAQHALEGLPSRLKTWRPYLRTVRGIHAELSQQ